MAENEKKTKVGFFGRISKWMRELKKVQWPSSKQTVNNTVIVIVCVVIVGAFIWIFDALASGVIGAILALFKG